MTSRLPKLVAFDLEWVIARDSACIVKHITQGGSQLQYDCRTCRGICSYTLWDLWIDTHVDPPLRRVGDAVNDVRDKNNQRIGFYRDVPEILHRLREAGVTIAACSRTHAPDLARKALNLLLVPPPAGHKGEAPISAVSFFDQMEIYPGSKIKHFKELHKKTGLPYSEMLFFDDERRNHEVESLGVTFCLVPNGLDDRAFERGLNEWRKRHPVEVAEDASASGSVGPSG